MPLNPEQVADVSRNWGKLKTGATPILTYGLSYQALSANFEDLQFIAGQKFSVEQVCRIFRVPPTLVQDLSHGTYTNVLELGSQFVRYSLQRWLSSWEADISRQLLGPIARRRYHAEHSVDALLRGNPEARATFYQTMIAAGVMDAEEARSLENFPARKVPHGS